MNFTSLKFGTRRMTQGSGVSSVAAKIGSTAFFAPLMVTSPCNRTPPFISKLSTELSAWILFFQYRDSRALSVVRLNRFHNPLSAFKYFADGLGLGIPEFEHKPSSRFQEWPAFTRQPAKNPQAIFSTIQRMARLIISHLRLQ